MPIKQVNFEDYMKWFDTHNVVIKGQTSSTVQFTTTKATAEALLEKVTCVEDLKALPIVDKSAQAATKMTGTDPGADFESVFEYYIDDEGVVMIKCDGVIIGPAVSLEWEKEVEEEEFEAGWEKVEEERDEEWALV